MLAMIIRDPPPPKSRKIWKIFPFFFGSVPIHYDRTFLGEAWHEDRVQCTPYIDRLVDYWMDHCSTNAMGSVWTRRTAALPASSSSGISSWSHPALMISTKVRPSPRGWASSGTWMRRRSRRWWSLVNLARLSTSGSLEFTPITCLWWQFSLQKELRTKAKNLNRVYLCDFRGGLHQLATSDHNNNSFLGSLKSS